MNLSLGAKVEGVVVYLDPQTNTSRVASCVGLVACSHYEHDASAIVIGYDVQVLNSVPWITDDLPVYYLPRNADLCASLNNPLRVVPYVFLPTRHVVRLISDMVEFQGSPMDLILNRFFRYAPYGWLVLHYQEVTCLSEPINVDGKPMRVKRRDRRAMRVRRVVGEVVDFGQDADGVAKLVCRVPVHLQSPSYFDGLDIKVAGGPFQEVALTYPGETLFKMAFTDVHDAYDQNTMGPQTYRAVLRHIVVNTLNRYRVKTVKYDNNFFYGFTEDGYHFAKNGRVAMNTAVPPLSVPDAKNAQYEYRKTTTNDSWLNLSDQHPKDAGTVRRGYIIYGRVVEKPDTGQMTLQWCCPPPGMDLLRVYLATEGKSPIFRTLSDEDILLKLKDNDGNDTLASDLFRGLIDAQVSNPAVDYVKRELLWAN